MAAKRKGKKSKSVSMMGSPKPFMKSAKKAENDDKPHVRPGPPSVNKNTVVKQNPRVKKLTGLLI